MNDSDIEMIELERAGNHAARLKKMGICVHGWTQGGVNAQGVHAREGGGGTCAKCLDCGRIFESEDALWHSRVMAQDEGVVT